MFNATQPVDNCRTGHGEGHHDDDVREEGEDAEDQVGRLSEPGLDHLKWRAHQFYKMSALIFSYAAPSCLIPVLTKC